MGDLEARRARKILKSEGVIDMRRDNMWKSLLLFIVMFGSLLWACEPGFTDNLEIKVIDSKYRPISGAAVNITYQKDETTGKGYVTSTTLYTGEDGKLSFTARNTEVFASRVECDITIMAEYDGMALERKIEAQAHSAELQMRFEDAYLLSLKVVDKNGQAIGNTQVRINDMHMNTSEGGYIAVIVNGGTVEMAVPYLGAVITKEVEVDSDLTYTLQARAYSLSLDVVDDRGDPLAAQITVEDETIMGTEVEIDGLAITNPYVKVAYGSVEKLPQIDLTQGGEYTVSFDLTPPEITDVEVKKSGNELAIRFFLKDPNALASGPDIGSTTVSYVVSGVTQEAVPYADSGAYAVEISAPPENTLLRFTITAYDMEGNMNTVNGDYLVTPGTGGQEPQENGSAQGGENGGETGSEPPSEDNGFLFLALGAVVVLVLAYVVIGYFRGLSDEE